MIDGDDANEMFLISLFSNGPFSVIALILAIIFTIAACNNEDECSKKQCPNGAKPKLMENSCLCATEAK